MSVDDVVRIKTALGVMAQTFGRRLDSATLLTWADRLEPLAGPKLWATFAACMDGDDFPTLKYLRMQAGGLDDAPNAFKPPPTLSYEEKRRADHAAILSMLWLHYTKGWKLEEFSGDILGRLFGKDPREALEKAKTIYDQPTVEKWMEARQ